LRADSPAWAVGYQETVDVARADEEVASITRKASPSASDKPSPYSGQPDGRDSGRRRTKA